MTRLFSFAAIVAATVVAFSCNRIETPQPEAKQTLPVTTKSFGEKTPIVAVYVETNDVNPLNAGDYMMYSRSFIDIVELFAANIHKETVGGQIRPTLYLNDKLTNVLENGGAATYVQPLQAMGIKVLLTVLGDWQHIGVANMNDEQSTQFAKILAYTVNRYGLDGIGFDDEYADYNGSIPMVSDSYSKIITKLRALLPTDKIITVFDWGHTQQISTTASSCIDYAYHGYFGSYVTNSNITGMTRAKWSPVSFNLGNNNSSSTAQDYASRALSGNYRALMCFNLRTRYDNDPLTVFQGLSNGAYGGAAVTCSNGNRPRTAGSVPGGYTITYAMAQ